MDRAAPIGVCVAAVACFGLGHASATRGAAAPRGAEAEAAALASLRRPGELQRAAALAPWLAAADPAALRTATASVEASFQHVGPGPVAMEMLCEAWSGQEPESALRRIQGWPVYFRHQATPLLLRAWARRDAAAAREAVLALDDALRPAATTAVIAGWAESQPPDLWERFAAGQPFGEEEVYLVVRQTAARDGAAATLDRVASSLPSQDELTAFERRALRAAVDLAARSDPEASADFIAQRAPASARARLQTLLARRWAERDGARAMQWLLERPEDPARDRALLAALRSWRRSDPEAARRWQAERGEELGLQDATQPRRAGGMQRHGPLP